jgi:ribosomal subunit interface protein
MAKGGGHLLKGIAVQIQITWRNVEQSEAVEADIREKIQKLEQFYDKIVSCKVAIEASHRRHHKGNLYRIHIVLEVPEHEIVVSRDPGDHHEHEDMYVTVRDAFDSARRQLQGYVSKRRGKVKQHAAHQVGRIRMLKPDEDYGFLETADGRDVYLHRNSLINTDFDDLTEGTEVYFVEEQGREGPQATRASVGKHHLPE